MEKAARTVGTRLLDLPYHLDTLYTYYVPETLKEPLCRGMFVIVPFGAGNRKMCALIEETDGESDAEKLKPVISVINAELALTDEMLELVGFLREKTLCTTGDAVRRLIPAEAFERAGEFYSAAEDFDADSLNQKSRVVWDYIRLHGQSDAKELIKKYTSDVKPLLSKLVKCGALKSELKIGAGAQAATELIVFPAEDADESKLEAPRTPSAYRPLYERIAEAQRIPLSKLVSEGFSAAHVRALEKRGLVSTEKLEKLRIPYSDADFGEAKTVLSDEQEEARKTLSALLDGKPHGALLYGVTGSGKTSVMLALCEQVVKAGKTAIVLVPEIALTWQSVAVFSSRFGGRLAVIHSALSGGERFDAYRRIRRGEVDVVLGTRSAIFSPLERLALIVIDEEQEHTYKSDMSPKYAARDAARFRCGQSGALLLLSSATPSVETYYRAKKGIYTLVELKNRFGGAELPTVTISDMRTEGDGAEFKILGEELSKELLRNFEEGHQSMLFLNRRGYSSFLMCRKCGQALLCPHCSVALTYHIGARGGFLVCHYCGYRIKPPSLCPSCKSEHLGYMGFGTQALEEAIHTLIPQAKVLRMDADTTQGKFSRDEIVGKFAAGQADILVGTQMIAKGHNFPNVTLAAVVSADSTLYSDDFRAGERTFSLITQLVGRSGRSTEPGRALLQTYSPENETIRLGAAQDYGRFFTNEIALRRALTFPPFCDIAVIGVSSPEETETKNFAEKLTDKLKALSAEKYKDVPLTVFGPFESPLYKLKNKYRMRIVIKHKNNKRARELFSELYSETEKDAAGKITVSVDINPTAT